MGASIQCLDTPTHHHYMGHRSESQGGHVYKKYLSGVHLNDLEHLNTLSPETSSTK